MAKEAVFTLKLESDLREQFMAEAAAAHVPASQVVREFMRSYVERQRQAREHDAWFRAEVDVGLKQLDSTTELPIPNEEVAKSWRERRAGLQRRGGRSPK